MRIIDASNTIEICFTLQVYSDVYLKKKVCYLPRIVDDQFLIPIQSRPSAMVHQYPNIGGGGLKQTLAPTFDIGGLKHPASGSYAYAMYIGF